MANLKLLLNNPKGFYFSGETLKGVLTLELLSAAEIKSLCVTCHGVAAASIERSYDDEGSGTVHYRSNEDVFNVTKRICLSENGRGNVPRGIYSCEFEFQLPHNLPSSLKHQYGSIKYFVQAKLVRTGSKNRTNQIEFSVQSDLSEIQRRVMWSMPPRNEITKEVKNCFCLSSGCILASLNLEKTSFAPGEAAKMWAHIKNESSRDVIYTEVKLEKEILLYAEGEKELLKKTVACEKRRSIKKGESVLEWSHVIQIPPGEPSVVSSQCRIININYTVKLIVHLSGWAKQVKVPLMILVGNTPQARVQNLHEEYPGCSHFHASSTSAENLHIPNRNNGWYGAPYSIENPSLVPSGTPFVDYKVSGPFVKYPGQDMSYL